MSSTQGADRLWATALLLPVVAAAVFALVRFALEGGDVPHDDDYRAALAVLEEARFDVERDAVTVLPPWSLRPHKELKRHRPISGDALHERPLHRYARLFVVVEPDAGQYTRPLLARLGTPAATVARGRVEVWRFDLGKRRVVYDLAANVTAAEAVILEGDDVVTRCDRKLNDVLSCGGKKSWQRVAREHQLVSENGQLVVWAHPPDAGQALEITWRDVPLGDVLVFSGGHTRSGSDSARAPVEVELFVGDEGVAALSFPPRFHFHATEIDTAAHKGARADVTVRIATENSGKNHFAFDAYLAEGGAP